MAIEKNQDPGGPFMSYQLNSTANLSKLALFLGKWAGLAALFSLTVENYYISQEEIKCNKAKYVIADVLLSYILCKYSFTQ